jgi:D-alanyl-D-alanine carboxypeptidase (penicillin-binding protein 5/6)
MIRRPLLASLLSIALLGAMVVGGGDQGGASGSELSAANRASRTGAVGRTSFSHHHGRSASPGASTGATRQQPARAPLAAAQAILIDVPTGRVLFARRPDDPRPIASLTKIMTAMLVLERADLDAVVRVTRQAAAAPPSVMGLRAGERITVRNLLYGLMLRSGNDAAIALAQHVSGSVPAFLALMNTRARELGLEHTSFASPNGLDDRGYSTARDLARLTRAAMADPRFVRLVDTGTYRMSAPAPRHRILHNINLFVGQYAGAIGVKTGYTSAAGDCLVAAAQRGGRVLIAVVLGEPTNTHWIVPFRDASTLLDAGFDRSRPLVSVQ